MSRHIFRLPSFTPTQLGESIPLPTTAGLLGRVPLSLNDDSLISDSVKNGDTQLAMAVASLLKATNVSYLSASGNANSNIAQPSCALEAAILKISPNAFDISPETPHRGQHGPSIPDVGVHKKPEVSHAQKAPEAPSTKKARTTKAGQKKEKKPALPAEADSYAAASKEKDREGIEAELLPSDDGADVVAEFLNLLDDIFGKSDVVAGDQERSSSGMLTFKDLQGLSNGVARMAARSALPHVPLDYLSRTLGVLELQVAGGESVIIEDGDDVRSGSYQSIMLSLEASHILLQILATPGMPKQLYAEEMIDKVMDILRFHLVQNVFVAYDATYWQIHRGGHDDGEAEHEQDGDEGDDTKPPSSTKGSKSAKKKGKGGAVGLTPGKRFTGTKPAVSANVMNKLCTLLGVVGSLLEATRLNDATVLKLVNTATATLGVDGLPVMQMKAISVLRTVFRLYREHRSILVDEMLAVLWKVAHATKRRLRTYQLPAEPATCVQGITALLMHCVQATPALPPSFTESTKGQDGNETGHDDEDGAEPRPQQWLAPAVEASLQFWRGILNAWGAAGKGGDKDADVKGVTESLVADLLACLNLPEWPSAALLLQVFCSLAGGPLGLQSKDYTARMLAIECLGQVATKLKQDAVRAEHDQRWVLQGRGGEALWAAGDEQGGEPRPDGGHAQEPDAVGHIADLAKKGSSKKGHKKHKGKGKGEGEMEGEGEGEHGGDGEGEPEFVVPTNEDVVKNLVLRAVMSLEHSDMDMGDTRRFLLSYWQQSGIAGDGPGRVPGGNPSVLSESWLRRRWNDGAVDGSADVGAAGGASSVGMIALPGGGSPLDIWRAVPRADLVAALRVIERQGMLQKNYAQLFDRLLGSLYDAATYPRAKAMKAVSAVVEADPRVLGEARVQRSVEARFMDAGASVREAALELVGKHIVANKDVALQYYDHVAERVLDTAVSVRKRVIRILQELVLRHAGAGFDKATDACARLISRINDEETSVQDLVEKALAELWFCSKPADTTKPSTNNSMNNPAAVTMPGGSAAATLPGSCPSATAGYPSSSLQQRVEQIARLLELLPGNGPVITVLRRALLGDKGRKGANRAEEDEEEGGIVGLAGGLASSASAGPKDGGLTPAIVRRQCEEMCRCLLENVLRVDESTAGASSAAAGTPSGQATPPAGPDSGPCSGAAASDGAGGSRSSGPGGGASQAGCSQSMEARALLYVRALHAFCETDPALCLPRGDKARYVVTLQPYLKTVATSKEASLLVQSILAICDAVIPQLARPPKLFVEEMQRDLRALIFRNSYLAVVHAAVKCLCTLATAVPSTQADALSLLQRFYQVVQSQGGDVDSSQKPHVMRGLFVLGHFCRYGASIIDAGSSQDSSNSGITPLTTAAVLDLFKLYLMGPDFELKKRALQACGGLFVARPDTLVGVLAMVRATLMKRAEPMLKSQSLLNLCEYLQDEETRLAQGGLEGQGEAATGAGAAARSKGDKGGAVPKAAGAGDSSVCSSIVAQLWEQVLELTMDPDRDVRQGALKVVELCLRNGLVHPISCVAQLVALEADADERVAKLAHRLVMYLEEKYPAFLENRLADGLLMAYKLQAVQRKQAQPQRGSGGKSPASTPGRPQRSQTTPNHGADNDSNLENGAGGAGGELILCSESAREGVGRVYKMLQAKKTSRNKFLSSIIHKFEGGGASTGFLLFLVQLLGGLPYSHLDEPLFLVYGINQLLQLQGSVVLSNLKRVFKPASGAVPMEGVEGPQTPAGADRGVAAQGEDGGGDGMALDDAADGRPGQVDKKQLKALSHAAVAMSLLILLKRHIKMVYGLNDARCQEFSPTEPGRGPEAIPAEVDDLDASEVPFGGSPEEKYKTLKRLMKEDADDFAMIQPKEGDPDTAVKRKRKTPQARSAAKEKAPRGKSLDSVTVHARKRKKGSDEEDSEEDEGDMWQPGLDKKGKGMKKMRKISY
eukprot:jgi/Mesvir1/11931/Mv00267-RA.1